MPLRVSAVATRLGKRHALGDFTVLVGPNNSGKSQTLRDIRDFVATGSGASLKILSDVEVVLPGEEEACRNISILPHQSPGHLSVKGIGYDLRAAGEVAVQEGWISSRFREAVSDPSARLALLKFMGRYLVAHLDAEGRFNLSNPTEAYDTRKEAPANAMQSLFAGGKPVLEELRAAFRGSFGQDIALDWAAMRRWGLRVGSEFGEIPDSREALDTLMGGAEELAQQGDGYRSFTGVALSLLSFSDRLLLLDEPEAFLHPAQARALGRWLAIAAQKQSSQIILATHNSDFLWGVVSANISATVIRLNRSGGQTTYHAIPADSVRDLAVSPLLSSQPVLDSLFHKGVAVCEGDPDRAVYQTVAHTELRQQGGEDILFIHSNGKDAIKTPLSLLLRAATPACAVVDIDVLNSEKVFGDIIEALTGAAVDSELLLLRKAISEAVGDASEEELLQALKASVLAWQESGEADFRKSKRSLEAALRGVSKWGAVKKEGVSHFSGEMKAKLEELLSRCRDFGLFVVPKGELENWVEVGSSKGREWNRKTLEHLHGKGAPTDLKDFVGGIVTYLRR